MQDSEIGGLMQRFNTALQVGVCKYCSAPAETSWGGSTSVLGDHFNLVCMTCFKDLTEFVRRPENANAHFEPGDEEAVRKTVTQFTDMQKRQDEFMRQQILQRKSK
jgi:hypothetical protein